MSTIKSCKGYTAHLCHLAYANSLLVNDTDLEKIQQSRSEFHVACTRSSLFLDIWGLPSPIMKEASQSAEQVSQRS